MDERLPLADVHEARYRLAGGPRRRYRRRGVEGEKIANQAGYRRLAPKKGLQK
ncbi:MAG: hypothetical protein AB1402_08590 [Bacillota bacterium]